MIGTFISDVRYALRALRRRPVFAATAVLTIALGIGANVAVFTIVDGYLFSPLPYEDPDELVKLEDENQARGWINTDVSPANAWDWRESATSLEDLAVFVEDDFNLTGDGPPELVNGMRTTPNLLGLLGRQPAMGRDFTAEEIGEGARVAILTDGFWARRFGRDRDVLGRTLTLDGDGYTVVGVLPPEFFFMDERPDLFVPMDIHPREADRNGHYAETVARLAVGTTVGQLQVELDQIAARLEAGYPETNSGWTIRAMPMHQRLVGDIATQAAGVLLGAVGFVLLMACVNVANLLLARASTRVREMSVRAALGAGRRRVVRQLLTESLVLAGIGGALGYLLAIWGYRAIAAGMPPDMPPVFQFGMDGSVVAYTIGITILAALIFGTLPALRTADADMVHLRDGGRGGHTRQSGRLGGTLVVLQTSMAVVLLVGGILLMKSLSSMRAQDFGFQPENVVTARISPPAAEYPDADAVRAFWDAVEEGVASSPEVVAVGSTQSHPLMGSNWSGEVRITGHVYGDEEASPVRLTYATPGLFDALRFRVVAGRPFQVGDGPDSPPVAVVNRAFVRRYLESEADALTTTFEFGTDEPRIVQIVGLIDDVVERSVESPPEPAIYLSLSQASTRTRSLVVRTAGAPGDVIPAIQEAVWAVDGDVPIAQVETMEALIDRRIGGFSVIGNLMATFALLALLLGGVGIYGVTAYAAGQRTAEIGLRLAMGADRGTVIKMVVLQGARRAVTGLVVGLGLAFLLAGAMSRLLIGVTRSDPVTFGAVTALLGGVALLALYLPARNASRVDPMAALAAD